MTIPSVDTTRYTYVGDDVSTSFPFATPFENDADLLCYLVDPVTDQSLSTMELNTDYTVTGGGGSTGTVILTVPLPIGTVLVILLSPDAIQTVDIVDGGALPATDLEYALDYLTLLARVQQTLNSRYLHLGDWSLAVFDCSLPTPLNPGDMLAVSSDGFNFRGFPTAAQRANQYLAFDSNGLPIAGNAVTTGSITASALGQLVVQNRLVTLTTVNSPYTAQEYDRIIKCDTTAGPIAINLPAKTGTAGAQIEVVKTSSDANAVTVTPNGTDEILGANSSQSIANQWTALRFLLLGTEGWVI